MGLYYRRQLREARTDLDIREAIWDRKQRESEGFDTLYDAIEEIIDNLDMPLTQIEVKEILKRSLRPEIRHEILNIPVRTVERLREIRGWSDKYLASKRKTKILEKWRFISQNNLLLVRYT